MAKTKALDLLVSKDGELPHSLEFAKLFILKNAMAMDVLILNLYLGLVHSSACLSVLLLTETES